jgi:site-specific recombinase XerC
VNITDALDRFLVQLEADGRSPHTVGQYRRHIRLLATWLAGEGRSVEVTAITHEVLARFLGSPAARTRPDGKTKRATSANCLRSSLRTFFAYLTQTGDLPTNPAGVIKRAMCASPPPRAMALDDQGRLLATLAAAEGPEAERDHLFFHLMLATGIRLGSALALQVSDIDLARAEITLRSMKGDRPESLPIGLAIRDHLARYLATRTTGPVFTRRDGHPLTPRHVERRFREWLKKAGITRPASPHSLRHAFATALYQRTGDVLLVKTALRHRSITSTLVYAKADVERLRKALG